MGLLNIFKLKKLLYFSLLLCLGMPGSAQAQNQHNCHKNSISDVICPQNTNVAPPGSAANPTGISGGSIFGSGGAIFSGALAGGGSAALTNALNSMSGLYNNLPPALQSALMSQVSALQSGGNLNASDVTQLVSLFTQLQSGFNALPTLGCGGGTLNPDFLVYAQNAYAQQISQMSPTQILAAGSGGVSSLVSGFQTQVTSSICTPMPGGIAGGGATSPGGTGTATQAPAAPPTPPGTVTADPSVTTGPGGWTLAHSQQAIQISQTDNAGSGYCAKGVANVLLQMGYSVTRGNAHDWDRTLPNNGWRFLPGVTPDTAPPGAVLVFDSDIHAGKPVGTTGGAKYGHVEIVTTTADGQRLYVSDKARTNWGGTVSHNYVGAWVQ